METSTIASATSTPARATDARIGLADDFDSFLQLLTTQLTSQDPLEPLDANQFTQQLVQFSGIEQAVKTNTTLDTLLSVMQADQFTRATDLVGAQAEALGDLVHLDESGGEASIAYTLARDGAAAAIQIQSDSGQVIRDLGGPSTAGLNQMIWDGRDNTGLPVAAGDYRVVVTAVDAGGSPIEASSRISGLVDGVELLGEQMMVSIGGVLVPRDLVVAIRREGTPA